MARINIDEMNVMKYRGNASNINDRGLKSGIYNASNSTQGGEGLPSGYSQVIHFWANNVTKTRLQIALNYNLGINLPLIRWSNITFGFTDWFPLELKTS